MSFPVFQQSAKGSVSASSGNFTFPSNNGPGNAIIVMALVAVATGTVTTVSVSDNNGNVYVPVTSVVTNNKISGWQAFACTNLKATPNPKITITVSGSGTGGPVASVAMLAGEWNNTNLSSAVGASASSAFTVNTISLPSQPAGTTAIGISMSNDLDNSHMFGPPPWAFLDSITFGLPAGIAFADSENFPAGTVIFTDTNGGTQVTLIVLSLISAVDNQWSHKIDAYVQALKSSSHNIDAYLIDMGTDRSHFIDAFIYKLQPGTLVRTLRFEPKITRAARFQPKITRTAKEG